MILVVLAAGVLLASASSAHAYYTESLPPTSGPVPGCIACHGTSGPTAADASGPHGDYATTTNKCSVCHKVHGASAEGVLLLPGATIRATCETCHDGTGGSGVYGAIERQLGVVASGHSVETTNLVPGGDPSSGTSSTVLFSGAGLLTCSDCHSPHGTDVVAPFTGDRARGASSVTPEAAIVSSRLLKRRPTTATQTVDVYGSDWCGGCHQGRLASSDTLHNHPVESTITASGVAPRFWYDRVVRVKSVTTTATEFGSLGRSNFGYVMPDQPRSAQQVGHYPICQQCHEDARRVGDSVLQQIVATELFSVTAADGIAVNDNPRFQTFPHESQNPGLLIEPRNNLCLNCHRPK